jgi:hypothetical protein
MAVFKVVGVAYASATSRHKGVPTEWAKAAADAQQDASVAPSRTRHVSVATRVILRPAHHTPLHANHLVLSLSSLLRIRTRPRRGPSRVRGRDVDAFMVDIPSCRDFECAAECSALRSEKGRESGTEREKGSQSSARGFSSTLELVLSSRKNKCQIVY